MDSNTKTDNATNINKQIEQMYSCDFCSYSTKKKKDHAKHLLTAKHKRLATGICIIDKTICPLCDKKYSSASNLWTHKKICKNNSNCNINSKTNFTAEMFMEFIKLNTKETQNLLLEQQKEFQNIILEKTNGFQNTVMELSKDIKPITHITNHYTNSTTHTNTQFNLNVFLNEDCKNAMSINQFIDSIKLTVNDLEETGRLGFIDGLSRIFINALKELELTARPIHCTDYKRETIYIKDENKWAKENDDKHTVVNVLRKIEKKNIGMLPTWINENPTCRTMDSPEAIQYYKIYKSALGDPSKEGIEKQDDKIIKNVLKEVVLDKK